MIPVTKTFLPPIEEYRQKLDQIWESNQISNGGNLYFQLEDQLKRHLKVSNIILTANGTLPLQIALKVLAKNGEVITTPFSYVATTSTIVWENCTPVFVDIHSNYLTIDETKIEAAITEKTTAILATHVYGNPCNVEEIEKIALKYNLKVIYDAAHCFGVDYKGKSIFEYGDISTCSFHATKIFHTGEGGAMFCKNPGLNHILFYSHNFGHNGPLNFHGLGINAKLNELQAAMGLTVLPYVDGLIEKRKDVVNLYNEELQNVNLEKVKIRENTEWNYSFYPIILPSEESLLNAMEKLALKDIHPRRYFYPSLNTLKYVKQVKMEISENIANRILCLPLYPGMEAENIQEIAKILKTSL